MPPFRVRVCRCTTYSIEAIDCGVADAVPTRRIGRPRDVRERRWVLAGALLAAACRGGGGPIVIGAAGPWSDTVPSLGTRQGIELAVDEINAAGGVRGRPLAVRWCDDSGTGVHAAVVAESLRSDPAVVAVIGHVTSTASLAAAPVYDGHVVAMSSQATSPDLSGLSPWVFRVSGSDSVTGEGLAAFALSRGTRRAAVLYENDAYGRGLARAFRRSFTAGAGTVLTVEPIPAQAASYEPYITYLARLAPDVVFVAGLQGSGVPLLREARRQRFETPFLSGDGWSGVTADVAASEGVYVAVPFVGNEPGEAVARFVAAFQARYHEAPADDGALAYDAVYVLAGAIRSRGASRNAIRAALAGLTTDRAYQGVTGPIAFDAAGDRAGRSFVVTRVHRGELQPLAR
jgi:branched-chain amino acid transport system substrate-binding protein